KTPSGPTKSQTFDTVTSSSSSSSVNGESGSPSNVRFQDEMTLGERTAPSPDIVLVERPETEPLDLAADPPSVVISEPQPSPSGVPPVEDDVILVERHLDDDRTI